MANNSTNNELENAQHEIERLKLEINRLNSLHNDGVSRAWIWLAFILFCGCLLMGNIALDYKEEYECAVENSVSNEATIPCDTINIPI